MLLCLLILLINTGRPLNTGSTSYKILATRILLPAENPIRILVGSHTKILVAEVPVSLLRIFQRSRGDSLLGKIATWSFTAECRAFYFQ